MSLACVFQAAVGAHVHALQNGGGFIRAGKRGTASNVHWGSIRGEGRFNHARNQDQNGTGSPHPANKVLDTRLDHPGRAALLPIESVPRWKTVFYVFFTLLSPALIRRGLGLVGRWLDDYGPVLPLGRRDVLSRCAGSP